ncbi:Mrr restriction system protein [Nitrosomonas stercoris]|uniref:Mrr restriction system protein n=1 Tax=Nitrosomonas stercoris TaxID=1444684 RepID=A0A4Y1YK45_9PROT|nr:Mrr restriction system protein [Nitrosomonas stercoris]
MNISLPTYDQFIEPILRILQQYPEGLRAAEVHDAAADYLQLTQEQRSELLSSGQAVYKNRCGWAHDRLKRVGLSFSPRRGLWQLSKEGVVYIKQNSGAIVEDEIQRIANSYYDGLSAAEDNKAAVFDEPLSGQASPDDQLEQALQALRQATAGELLEVLLAVTPSRFEVIVLDVLHGLGYGISRQDLQRVGGSGDAGIDGVISLDKLGLEKVYVQAKRWQGTVGRPELQAFYGALAGQKAKRGVFITTSAFTAQALDFAKSVEGIVLIDGERLVNLMMDTEVGVTSRTLKVPSLDSDYFE